MAIEEIFGLKNKIKWVTSFKIVAIHLVGIWWVWHYSLPAKLLTPLFALFMFYISGVGITGGAHRLFTHKAFKATLPLKIFLLFCFVATGQNSLYSWVRDHRLHHKLSDTEADPHNAHRGFFFSHIGWLMTKKNDEVLKQGKKIDMSDLENDKIVMFFSRHSTFLSLIFCFILPTITGVYYWNEDWKCAMAWQCFIRYLCLFHSELSVNSFAHIYGYTPYNKQILPKENLFVSISTFGEGWHNYHHVFPYDYKASEFCDIVNLTAKTINMLEKVGLAYDLKQASPEMVKSVVHRLASVNEKYNFKH